MLFKSIFLVISFAVWLSAEGILVLRDRKNAKGSTEIDKMTRWFNAFAIVISSLSPVFLWAIPNMNFNGNNLPVLTFIGSFIIVCGFILRHWSIHVLGKYFRTTVEIEEEQPIIQSGPYRYIRHPSYSGIVLFFIGYGLLSQNWISLIICVVLPIAVLLYRICVEEKALVKVLGPQYKEYQSKTKKLIPGVW